MLAWAKSYMVIIVGTVPLKGGLGRRDRFFQSLGQKREFEFLENSCWLGPKSMLYMLVQYQL